MLKKKREEQERRARDFRRKYPNIYGGRRWWQP